MGSRFGFQNSQVQLNALPANATATAIFTAGPLVQPGDAAMVLLVWGIVFVPGTGCTSLIVAMIRGYGTIGLSVPGASWGATVVAASKYVLIGSILDAPVGSTDPYTLVVSQLGATAAGTIADGGLTAFAL